MKRVALVTGGNKGIGFHVAEQLLATCSLVILACRDAGRGDAAVAKLAAPNAKMVVLDISDGGSIDSFAAAYEKEVGQLDVLVNNAAIAFKGADPTPFEGQTGPTLKTNYYGTVALTERLLPLVRKSENGCVVNVASMAAKLAQVSPARQAAFTSPDLTKEKLDALVAEFASDVAAGRHKQVGWGNSNYGFSKLCVIAHTKLLARRLGGGVRVNACCPGYCRTDMASNRGPRPPEVGARNVVLLADPTSKLNGEFIQDERVSTW